jgi:hypothetical protein
MRFAIIAAMMMSPGRAWQGTTASKLTHHGLSIPARPCSCAMAFHYADDPAADQVIVRDGDLLTPNVGSAPQRARARARAQGGQGLPRAAAGNFNPGAVVHSAGDVTSPPERSAFARAQARAQAGAQAQVGSQAQAAVQAQVGAQARVGAQEFALEAAEEAAGEATRVLESAPAHTQGVHAAEAEAESVRLAAQAARAEAESVRLAAQAAEAEAESVRLAAQAAEAEAESARLAAQAAEAEAASVRLAANVLFREMVQDVDITDENVPDFYAMRLECLEQAKQQVQSARRQGGT